MMPAQPRAAHAAQVDRSRRKATIFSLQTNFSLGIGSYYNFFFVYGSLFLQFNHHSECGETIDKGKLLMLQIAFCAEVCFR